MSIRIPKKLKGEMDKLKDIVDWSSEIRAFIGEKVRTYRRIKVLEEVDRILEQLSEAPVYWPETYLEGQKANLYTRYACSQDNLLGNVSLVIKEP